MESITIPLTGSKSTTMHPINTLEAELKAIGRKVTITTSISLIVHETEYLPKLLIIKKINGWEVYTIPKRIIITFKEMEPGKLIEKLAKANYLSEYLNFNALK